MSNGNRSLRLLSIAMLALVLALVIWALFPLYDVAGLLLGAAAAAVTAWGASTFAIRRGFMEGGYAVILAIYSIAGAIIWALIWAALPLLRFWEPITCQAWQGPSSQCDIYQYLAEQSFWVGFGALVLLIPHSLLAALIFLLRAALPSLPPRIAPENKADE